MELGCYICNLGARINVQPRAVFIDGRFDLCLGFCLNCNGAACTNHAAWIEKPRAQYTCSVCVGEWISRGGDSGPLHRRDPTPILGPGGVGQPLTAREKVETLRAIGVVEPVVDAVREAFAFWAHRLYESDDIDVYISEPVTLRNVYSRYMVASEMEALIHRQFAPA